MPTAKVNTPAQCNKHTREVWFSFTDLVKESPPVKNNAKLIPSLLKKEDGSRERKKKRKVGQKDCSAAHQRQMDYFFTLQRKKSQDSDE